MTTEAAIGYGTLFQIRTSIGPDVWATIGEQTGWTPPAISADTHEATHSESPNSRKEFVAGLVDEGEMGFDVNLTPGVLAQLRGYVRQLVTSRLVFPDDTKWQFDAILTGVEASAPIDDKMSASVTLKLTGESELQAAAAPANSVLPAISGVLTVGQVLTAYPGEWSNVPRAYAYQWKSAGTDIAGATARTYALVAGDTGDAITVAVTATNSAGSATAASAAVLIG